MIRGRILQAGSEEVAASFSFDGELQVHTDDDALMVRLHFFLAMEQWTRVRSHEGTLVDVRLEQGSEEHLLSRLDELPTIGLFARIDRKGGV